MHAGYRERRHKSQKRTAMTPFQHISRPSVFSPAGAATRPVTAVTPADLDGGAVPSASAEWAKAAGFKADAGALLAIPGEGGGVAGALFGLGSDAREAPFLSGKLFKQLPSGDWSIQASGIDAEHLALGFGLGSYSFAKYKSEKPKDVRLAMPQGVDAADIERQLAGIFLARDLINTPTNDMGPAELEAAFRALGEHYGATVTSTVGDELLERNFPLVHTVGRASVSAPRLLEMRWGRQGDPRVTLVGKGVCFDTGGLDLKGAANMALMKKDMGGAANVLGLALMIMDAGLAVDLQVLVPAVENSVSGNAFRPGDIYKSRKGITVQIDNTDAEGRLVLADALAYADETPPDLLVDMATLTGAARTALGPELAPFFTDDEALAGKLQVAARDAADPVWRMPLWMGYDKDIRSRAADITNSPSGGMAGSITAALFLKRFVTAAQSWIHFDIYGWNLAEKPHAPVGGEAFAIRALYRVIRDMAEKKG
jgi:leucyl aminopeptidase